MVASLVVLIGLAGFVWLLITMIKADGAKHAEPPVVAPAPQKRFHLAVFDAGATRFVDFRSNEPKAWISNDLVQGVAEQLRPPPEINLVCFVLSPAWAAFANALDPVGHVLFFGRFRDAAGLGPMMVTVFVDGGAFDATAVASAKLAKVETAIEWPVILGTDPATGLPRRWTGQEIVGPSPAGH